MRSRKKKKLRKYAGRLHVLRKNSMMKKKKINAMIPPHAASADGGKEAMRMSS
jgi:hypothetical protein